MEKRLLGAVVLSMAVLLLTQVLIRRYFPAPQPPIAKTSQQGEPAGKAKADTAIAPPPPLPQTAAGTRRDLVVEGDDYRAVVDSQGAVLKSFQLKKYRSKSNQALELIPQKLPAAARLPFALDVAQKTSLTQRLNQVVYEVQASSGSVEAGRFAPPVDLAFRYGDAEIHAEKHLKFYAKGYVVEATAHVWEQNELRESVLLLGPDIGTEAGETESDFQARQVAVNVAGAVQRELFPDGKSRVYAEPVSWAGFETKYFAALAISDPYFSSLAIDRFDTPSKDSSGKDIWIPYYRLRVPGDKPVKFYLGPKDHDNLDAAKPGLSSVIDYGWFSFIVKPLLLSLKFVQRFVRNWGVAIIVLTLLISLALFPIRYKQMVSMKKMQALQPKMRSIQDRYKKYKRTDPKRQEMNAEIMKLYKEHGVNPLGGCLPLLIQMPFLFAFYRMLDGAIELRDAPFVFWIRDLSKMDPYYVTPILMGLTMVLQQKMTPQTIADPTQARMMTLMPIIFTAMFFSLSSGLVIYFLFSNLFAMGFQKLSERWIPAEQEQKSKWKGKRVKE